MQQADIARFNQLVTGVCLTFGRDPEPFVLDVYWITLRDWSIEEFEQGCAHILKTAKFMPRPSDFEDLRKAGRMTPGEAFAAAMVVARDCSRHTPSSSGDPRIDAAASACGGYFAMGQQETEKIGWLERRFVEHYESISDAEDVREALPQLTGPPRGTGGPKRIGSIHIGVDP